MIISRRYFTDKLDDPDDIKADDLGSWKNYGQHSRWVKVKQLKDGSVSNVEFCSRKPKKDPSAYCLHHHYFVHYSDIHFKRKIVYLCVVYMHVLVCWYISVGVIVRI